MENLAAVSAAVTWTLLLLLMLMLLLPLSVLVVSLPREPIWQWFYGIMRVITDDYAFTHIRFWSTYKLKVNERSTREMKWKWKGNDIERDWKRKKEVNIMYNDDNNVIRKCWSYIGIYIHTHTHITYYRYKSNFQRFTSWLTNIQQWIYVYLLYHPTIYR